RLEQRGKGVLPALATALKAARQDLLTQAALDLIEQRLLPATEASRERAGAVFDLLEEVCRRARDPVVRLDRGFDDDPVWQLGLAEALEALLLHLDELLQGVEALRERFAGD